MSRRAGAAIALGGVTLLALVCGLEQARPASRAIQKEIEMAPVIFTAAPVYESLAAFHGDERFPRGAQLMVLRAGRSEVLAPGFAASADASVAFDAKTVLFAGKKNAGDRWGIWEVAVEGGTARLVLGGTTDLIRPLWMPDGRMVYARREVGGFALEATGLDGSGALKLSYLPGSFIPDDVLRDGRVLFETGFPLGAGSTPEIFLVYADGSGVESVRCDHGDGRERLGREHGRQLLSGDILFTHGAKLARFTSALAEETAVAAPAGDFAGDVAEMPDGRWLLAVRRLGAKHYGLAAFRPGDSGLELITQDASRDLVEPVVVTPRAVPNRHPSGLHDWAFGNLLALDARQSRIGALSGTPALVRAETQNDAGQVVSLGTAPVEKDGSFFVQATGDRPLRFILLDEEGRTLRQEQGWFWVRRGEQRICVGCHTGPERAPNNRVPEVLLRSTTPVDMTGRASGSATGGH
jgi:Hydrazine synthase alpha subunit middle domain